MSGSTRGFQGRGAHPQDALCTSVMTDAGPRVTVTVTAAPKNGDEKRKLYDVTSLIASGRGMTGVGIEPTACGLKGHALAASRRW